MSHLPVPSFHVFRELIHESVDAVVIIDSALRVRYVNPALERLVGYGAAELIGESLNGLLPDEMAADHRSQVEGYLSSFKPSPLLGKVRELQVRHRCGETIPIELKALDLGVHDGERFFGAFMVDIRLRKALQDKNVLLLAKMHEQALTDALTGLPNRRAFDDEAVRLLLAARRERFPVAVGVADIDYFKSVNDRYGHASGDQVLRGVAQTLQAQMRACDFIGRIGGEEFGLLLRGSELNDALAIADRLRAAVAATPIVLAGGINVAVTISIGVAPVGNRTFAQALSEADRAMYQAKQGGRNRVACIAEAPAPAGAPLAANQVVAQVSPSAS